MSSGGGRGGGGGSGASVAASTATEEAEDDAAPRVDTYDKASGEGEDERELLDAAPHGTLGLQRLPPPPTTSMTSKLARGASELVLLVVDVVVVCINLDAFDFGESILSDWLEMFNLLHETVKTQCGRRFTFFWEKQTGIIHLCDFLV